MKMRRESSGSPTRNTPAKSISVRIADTGQKLRRDVATRKYFGLDTDILRDILAKKIPDFGYKLDMILGEL